MAEKIDISQLPTPQVIENGKPADTSAIDDYDGFMGFLMQASMATNLTKVRKIEEDRVSKGEIYPIDALVVTATVQPVECPEPAQSFYIENTGGADLSLIINSMSRAQINVPQGREFISQNSNHVIERIFIWSPGGTTARIVFSY